MKLAIISAAAVAAAFVSPAPAGAARIVYTYSSTFTGMNDSNPFVIGATFTGVGDTGDGVSLLGFTVVPLSSFTAQADGPYVITTPFSFVSSAGGAAAFVADIGSVNAFAFASPALFGYDGRSAVSAVVAPFLTNATFATDRGNIVLTGQSMGTFSAVVDQAAGAVPETTTWAMMIGGFGLIGGVLRRRRIRTTVRFA